jgi:hypothetical protein
LRISGALPPVNGAVGQCFNALEKWQHDVLFEGSYPKEPGKKYPVCLAGELAGPLRL